MIDTNNGKVHNTKNKVYLEDSDMQYVSFGHGENTLVIIPGLSDGLATVQGKALLLAGPYRPYFEKYTVYIFSRKDNMPEGYTIREMAQDQFNALMKLGLEKVSVLGVSEGGMIAQCLAINHPELLEKLVIAVSAPEANNLVKENVIKWIELAKQGNHKDLMIDTSEKSYSEKYLKKYRKLYPFIGLVGRPKNYIRFLINANAILGFDVSNDLSKITCPTLIIGGKDDRIVGPDASFKMHEKIIGSELYMYDGLGHAAYEEALDFNERVFNFLDRQ